MLRPDFVERKLQLITDDLGRLSGFREIEYATLVADEIQLAAVERLLERIVTRAVDVNQHVIGSQASGSEDRTTRLSYRDTFLALSEYGVYPPEFGREIAPSAGLRNILVHDYNDVDRHILHRSIHNVLTDFAAYVDHLRAFLAQRGGPPGG